MAVNTDIRLSTRWSRHPKIKLLRKMLGADAVLSLIDLWCFVAEERPKGILTGLSPSHIESAANWDSLNGEFFNALVTLALLDVGGDNSISVHDWAGHQPWASTIEERSEIGRNNVKKRWDKVKAANSETMPSEYDANTSGIQLVYQTYTPAPKPLPLPKPNQDQNQDQKPRPRRSAKNAEVTFALPDDISPIVWAAFEDHRKKKRAAMNDHTRGLVVAKIRKLGGNPDELLNTAMEKGWQTVYPINDGGRNGAGITPGHLRTDASQGNTQAGKYDGLGESVDLGGNRETAG